MGQGEHTESFRKEVVYSDVHCRETKQEKQIQALKSLITSARTLTARVPDAECKRRTFTVEGMKTWRQRVWTTPETELKGEIRIAGGVYRLCHK